MCCPGPWIDGVGGVALSHEPGHGTGSVLEKCQPFTIRSHAIMRPCVKKKDRIHALN